MLCTKIVLNAKEKWIQQFVYTTCSAGILSLQISWTMNNLLSYCGLFDAKIRSFWHRFTCMYYLFLLTSSINVYIICILRKLTRDRGLWRHITRADGTRRGRGGRGWFWQLQNQNFQNAFYFSVLAPFPHIFGPSIGNSNPCRPPPS